MTAMVFAPYITWRNLHDPTRRMDLEVVRLVKFPADSVPVLDMLRNGLEATRAGETRGFCLYTWLTDADNTVGSADKGL